MVLLDLLELLLILTSLGKLLCNEGHLLCLLFESLVKGEFALLRLLLGLLVAGIAPNSLSRAEEILAIMHHILLYCVLE